MEMPFFFLTNYFTNENSYRIDEFAVRGWSQMSRKIDFKPFGG